MEFIEIEATDLYRFAYPAKTMGSHCIMNVIFQKSFPIRYYRSFLARPIYCRFLI